MNEQSLSVELAIALLLLLLTACATPVEAPTAAYVTLRHTVTPLAATTGTPDPITATPQRATVFTKDSGRVVGYVQRRTSRFGGAYYVRFDAGAADPVAYSQLAQAVRPDEELVWLHNR